MLPAALSAPTVKQDDAVRTGKLKNGLTYYIRHNAKEPGLADFYIAQRVGSIPSTTVTNITLTEQNSDLCEKSYRSSSALAASWPPGHRPCHLTAAYAKARSATVSPIILDITPRHRDKPTSTSRSAWVPSWRSRSSADWHTFLSTWRSTAHATSPTATAASAPCAVGVSAMA